MFQMTGNGSIYAQISSNFKKNFFEFIFTQPIDAVFDLYISFLEKFVHFEFSSLSLDV